MRLVASQFGRLALGLAASSCAALLYAGTASAATSPSSDSSHSSTVITQATEETTQTSVDAVKQDNHVVTVAAVDSSTTPPGAMSNDVTNTALGDARDTGVTSSSAEAVQLSSTPAGGTNNDDQAKSLTPAATSVVSAPNPPLARELVNINNSVLRGWATLRQSQPVYVSAASSSAPLAMPTLAQPAVPHPQLPQSSGLLRVLSSELSGILAPQLYSGLLHGTLTHLPVSYLPVVILVTICLNLLGFTYGSSLRRAGFSTAARSDAAPLIFATPRLMDYGFTRIPIVLFGGVRYQNPHIYNDPNAVMKGGE